MRVLVIFPGALGDLLLLAPSIATLMHRGARVEISVQRALRPVVELVLRIPAGPPVDGVEMGALYAAASSAALARWVRGADVVHAWLGRDAHELARGLRDHGGAAVVLHSVVRGDGPRHASEEYAAMVGVRRLRALEPAVASLRCPIDWACGFDRRLVVHAGAGSRAKRWDQAGFASVAAAWNDGGGQAVVLCGPAEDDAARWQAAGLQVASGLDLMGAAGLLASAASYVGNDSGISHLAGALGRFGVVLFGPTNPERWRPLAADLAVVRFTGRAPAEVATAVLERARRRLGPT